MIAFAAPWALLGLVAAGVPLLLHLVQRHQAPEVMFPAVRYLEDATRQQLRRLRLRHWLLLAIRTLLIVAVVLAAAGTTVRRAVIGPHAASAMVLIVDNSAASAAVVDGEPVLATLVRAAARVLDRATLSDRLWLVAADGVARAGSAAELKQRLAALHAEPLRLDLGRAVATARTLVRSAGRPGSVVLVSALPRSGLSAAAGSEPLLVLRPAQAPPANRAVVALSAGLQPWSPGGGRITLTIVSNDTAPVPVSLALGGRVLRDVLVVPGIATVQRIATGAAGWSVLTASIPPDEFRLDDSRSVAVRAAPPAAVRWDTADRYIAAAAQVLAADGRIRAGSAVDLGTLGPGVSIVMPPDDPARVGAVNRALAARGSSWQFGDLVVASGRFDSSALMPARETVARRYALRHGGAAGEVLATVDGAPWAAMSGGILLIGSRLDPAWTSLPLSAAFVPFLDAIVSRIGRGEFFSGDLVPGQSIRLPDRVTAIGHDGSSAPAQGGSSWSAPAPGVFLLLAGGDTVGALTVQLDPRVSDLARASDRDVRALWPGTTVAALQDGYGLAFAAVSRGDLRAALLLLALCCAIAETMLTGRVRKRG